MRLWSPPLPVSSFLTVCPFPCPTCPVHTLLFGPQHFGPGHIPIPRVLFSAGEGKRCWLLSRDAYVDVKDPRYCPLTPASSGGEKGTGKERGTLGPYREWTLGDSHPLFPLTKCPGDPWLRPAQALVQWQGKRGTSLHLEVI